MSLAALELDLDVFSGPFDLLLTLVLREEVDLLELQLADVVLAYLDHLEQRGELDLETATEFIVLIAALLELKSRLMLSGEEERAARHRARAGRRGAARADARRAPLPRRRRAPAPSCSPASTACASARRRCRAHLRRTVVPPRRRLAGAPTLLGEAIGRLLRDAARDQRAPHRRAARHRSPSASRTCAALLRRGAFSFDEAVRGADRMTVAVTLFALLELYKRGEAGWEPAGVLRRDRRARARGRGAAQGAAPRARARRRRRRRAAA